MAGVRDQIHAQLPGVRVEFVQILQDMIGDLSGTPNPVEVKVFGADQAALERTAAIANGLVGKIEGIVDTFDGITRVGPTYRIEVDEQRAKMVGLSAMAVQGWLETAITGSIVGQVEKPLQPIVSAVGEGFELLPIVTAADGGANGDDDDIQEEMPLTSLDARVAEFPKMFLDGAVGLGHGFPP